MSSKQPVKRRGWGYWGFVALFLLVLWAATRQQSRAPVETPNLTMTAVGLLAATAETRAQPLIEALEAVAGIIRVEYAAVQLNEGEAWVEARIEGAQDTIQDVLREARRLFPNMTLLRAEIRDSQRLSYLWEDGETAFAVVDLSNGETLEGVEVE